MDDLYVFLKNDRNLFLKQLHFIISLISFLFLILTHTVDSVIVALAIPGTVINSAILLGLYCLDERHDFTDIGILTTYGILNLLAAMIFANKLLQMDISIFRMLFLNSYTINILLCLCSGFLMLGEGLHRLIVLLVRNIYNSTQNSQKNNVPYKSREPNSPEVNSAPNASPNILNSKTLPTNNVLSYAEKDTNTNPYEDILLNRNAPLSLPLPIDPGISNMMQGCTGCSHYRLNSEHDKHRNNSGDNGYVPEKGYTENDRRSGDGVHCNKNFVENEKPFVNKEVREPVQHYFYPKTHVARPITKYSKNINTVNDDGLPVFVDRYGKKYIASLAGGIENHLSSANTASLGYDTSSGDCKKKASTPINEFYTNRKYSNSKVTITQSKDDVNTNDSSDSSSKGTQECNIAHNNNNNNKNNINDNITNGNTNNKKNSDIKVADNEHRNNTNKTAHTNDFLTNYNKYLAHLYKNNTCSNNKKILNYKFYNHNYDYQWVCEA